MAVVAALDDPLAVLATDDLADVMAPDHDRTDRRTTGVAAVVRPRPREVVLRARIGTDLLAHVPTAPGGWPAADARGPVAGLPVARLPIARARVTRTTTAGILFARISKSRAEARSGIKTRSRTKVRESEL